VLSKSSEFGPVLLPVLTSSRTGHFSAGNHYAPARRAAVVTGLAPPLPVGRDLRDGAQEPWWPGHLAGVKFWCRVLLPVVDRHRSQTGLYRAERVESG
jgi:hypothetical protein